MLLSQSTVQNYPEHSTVLLFYEGYKRLLQCRAKGNESLICNLLLITSESNCRSHQHSCLVFLLKSRNKCYKFGLDLTVFSIPFTIGRSWAKVYFASCYCRVIAHCKAEVARNGLSLNYPERISMGCFSTCSPRNCTEVLLSL